MIPNANSKEDGIPCSTMVIENLFKNIEKQCQISEESQLLIVIVHLIINQLKLMPTVTMVNYV